MLAINDNLGIIVDNDYLNAKACIFNKKDLKNFSFFELLQQNKYSLSNAVFKNKEQILKGARFVNDSQHEIEEAKLSVKIAKLNCKLNISNNYYLQELEKAEHKLKILKTKC
jgi:hypothetical protein